LARPAVIVVNSHVVRGGVGGRSAVPALERMGFPVWSLTTVALAWHPGHGRSTRTVPDAAAFEATVAELAASPKLGEVGAILIGYLGAIGQVDPLAQLVMAVKRNPSARFLYDPNIGDGGTLFQPAVLAAKARDVLLPLADIATPNRFELGWLTGAPVKTGEDVAKAAARLGPGEVVVTSASEAGGVIATMLAADGLVTTAEQTAVMDAPKGTGDLFAALYLGQRLKGRAGVEATRRAAAAVGRSIARAAAEGLDELPAAASADDLDGNPDDVAITARA
jgi:pyridoxine kinase